MTECKYESVCPVANSNKCPNFSLKIEERLCSIYDFINKKDEEIEILKDGIVKNDKYGLFKHFSDEYRTKIEKLEHRQQEYLQQIYVLEQKRDKYKNDMLAIACAKDKKINDIRDRIKEIYESLRDFPSDNQGDTTVIVDKGNYTLIIETLERLVKNE
jgi:uncharacterized protein YfkK (UPF0435 family)